jgi:hypothetical protein
VKRLLVVAVVLAAAAGGAAWYLLRGGTFTITLTQAELEQQLGKRFPLRKKYLELVDVAYENPRVVLTDGSDVIGIGVDARVAVPLKGDVVGGADIRTKLAYDAERTALVLHEPKLEKVQLPGVDAKLLDGVRAVANSLVSEQLPGIPVYTLKPSDAKRTIARAVLKSVTVRDGQVVLELGL